MNNQSERFEDFCDTAFIRMMRMTPEAAALMGISKHAALNDTSDQFADFSEAGFEARNNLVRDINQDFNAFERAALSASEQLSFDIFRFFLDYPCFRPWAGMKGLDFAYHDYPVKHLDGAPNDLVTLMTTFHNVNCADDAEAYISRLSKISKVLNDCAAGMRMREALGLVPPKNALSIVSREIEGFLSSKPTENTLYTSFAEKLQETDAVDRKSAQAFLERAEQEISRSVLPGHQSLLETVKEQQAAAPDELGVWRFPRGDEYYAYMLALQTTTDLTPDQVHELGHDQIKRVKIELAADLAALGKSKKPLGEAFAELEGDASFKFSEGPGRRGEILDHYRQLLRQARTALPPYFGIFPKADCVIEPCPAHLEENRTTTYFPPSADGSKPGVFELNLGMELDKPRWALANLAYHEAFPGHHLQFAIAQELEGLPLFRRTVLNAAYIEGWAKYAERLPFEFGINGDPYYELNRKRMELISCVNLALDTGIHHKRWTREQAVSFFAKNALTPRQFAEYIVDRIAVTPGQTSAYAIGLLKVRELRQKVTSARGESFDIREFHDLILGKGSMPLSVLEDSVTGHLLD